MNKGKPITFMKHRYDVDIVEAINNLTSIVNSGKFLFDHITPDVYIERLWEIVKAYCELNGLDYEYLRQHQIVVPSNQNFYPVALAIQLMITPVHRINRFLDEQEVQFKGNHYAASNNFVGLVEYYVCDFIENNTPFDNSQRLNKIMEWVREKRNNSKKLNINPVIINILAQELNFSTIYKEVKNIIQVDIKKHEESKKRTVKIQIIDCNNLLNEFYEGFKYYFNEDDHRLLRKLLEGVNIEKQLNFSGNQNILVELFKRAKYHQKIVCENTELADWLIDNFNYYNKKKKKFKSLNKVTVLGILDKFRDEPGTSKIILTDILPYKKQYQR